jgi:hypothetical protein
LAGMDALTRISTSRVGRKVERADRSGLEP